MLLKKSAPFYYLIIFFLLVNVLLRLVLILHPITQAHFTFVDISKIFLLGFLSDTFIFILASVFLWLYLLFISNDKYKKPYGYILFGLFVTLFLYVRFGNTILNEYGGSLPEVVSSFENIAVRIVAFLA